MRLTRPGLSAFCLGAVAAAGHVPLSLFPLTIAGLAGLIAVIASADTGRSAALRGWAGGSGWFLASLYWVVEPFLVEPEKTLWMAPFGLAGLCLGLAVFWGLASFVARAGRAGSPRRIASVVVALSLGELARGYLLTGFPWALPAYVWADTPVAQWSAWVGPFGLSALTFALSGLLAAALPGVGTAQQSARLRPHAGTTALMATLLTLILLLGGMIRQLGPLPPDKDVTIRIVQPNAPQHLKWRPDMAPVYFQRLLDGTGAPSANGTKPDLILWPETSITPWLNEAGPTFETIAAHLPPRTELVLGLRRYQGRRYYNSMILIDGSARPRALYDKEHLVPFGEYLPFGGLAAALGLHGLAAEEGGGYSAGQTRSLIGTARAGRFLPLICYEAIFPQEMSATDGARADWLAQLTNDAWFGQFAGPQQHLVQARFRAIEQGLPMLRAANTGISAVVDARGHVRQSIAMGQSGFIDAPLPGTLPRPPYSRSGDLGLLLLLLGMAGALLWRGRGQK